MACLGRADRERYPRHLPDRVLQLGSHDQWGRHARPMHSDTGPITGSSSLEAGACIVDSVTRFDPLNDPQTSIFGSGNREKYDLSVGGGSEAVRYFVAGASRTRLGWSHFRRSSGTSQIVLI